MFTRCSGLFSNPHLVKKEFVVRSHRKSISPEVISFARELIDVVDILTVRKKNLWLCCLFSRDFVREFGTFSDFWTRSLRRNYGSRKGTIQKYFANPKKYFKSQCFFKNHCRRVCQIQKTITNPKKISRSTNNSFNNSKIFCKSINTISNRNFCTNHY